MLYEWVLVGVVYLLCGYYLSVGGMCMFDVVLFVVLVDFVVVECVVIVVYLCYGSM